MNGILLNTNLIFEPDEKSNESACSTIVHDLKSPTHSQIQALKLLLGGSFGDINPQQREVVTQLLHSCYYMKDLIGNILFSNNLNAMTLNFSDFSFEDLIEDCISEMFYLTDDKKQILSFEGRNLDDTTIKADKLAIKRVICNLITNAVNYSYEKTQIKISLHKTEYNMHFSIINSGDLIPEIMLTSIFNSGVSGCLSQGQGLGLNIVKQVIEAHNGKIVARTLEPCWNIFEFSLPY